MHDLLSQGFILTEWISMSQYRVCQLSIRSIKWYLVFWGKCLQTNIWQMCLYKIVSQQFWEWWIQEQNILRISEKGKCLLSLYLQWNESWYTWLWWLWRGVTSGPEIVCAGNREICKPGGDWKLASSWWLWQSDSKHQRHSGSHPPLTTVDNDDNNGSFNYVTQFRHREQ